jgi:hypothetical protein
VDNDLDGLTDSAGGDPGCDAPGDLGEHAATLPCDDGIDNDGDGLRDYPADPGCASPSAATESPECDDGIDNDGDGGIDTDGNPPDPECDSVPSHFDEAIPVPEPSGILMLVVGVCSQYSSATCDELIVGDEAAHQAASRHPYRW